MYLGPRIYEARQAGGMVRRSVWPVLVYLDGLEFGTFKAVATSKARFVSMGFKGYYEFQWSSGAIYIKAGKVPAFLSEAPPPKESPSDDSVLPSSLAQWVKIHGNKGLQLRSGELLDVGRSPNRLQVMRRGAALLDARQPLLGLRYKLTLQVFPEVEDDLVAVLLALGLWRIQPPQGG